MNTLEFAVGMELEGQKFYSEQADLNKDNELQKVFQILANSEKEHAETLLKRQKLEAYELIDMNVLPSLQSIFSKMKDFTGKQEISSKQLDVYRLACSQEEKSIQLYHDMLSEAKDAQDTELFKFLLRQEHEHLILFEGLVTMLTRPEEWVESPEFGIREEY